MCRLRFFSSLLFSTMSFVCAYQGQYNLARSLYSELSNKDFNILVSTKTDALRNHTIERRTVSDYGALRQEVKNDVLLFKKINNNAALNVTPWQSITFISAATWFVNSPLSTKYKNRIAKRCVRLFCSGRRGMPSDVIVQSVNVTLSFIFCLLGGWIVWWQFKKFVKKPMEGEVKDIKKFLMEHKTETNKNINGVRLFVQREVEALQIKMGKELNVANKKIDGVKLFAQRKAKAVQTETNKKLNKTALEYASYKDSINMMCGKMLLNLDNNSKHITSLVKQINDIDQRTNLSNKESLIGTQINTLTQSGQRRTFEIERIVHQLKDKHSISIDITPEKEKQSKTRASSSRFFNFRRSNNNNNNNNNIKKKE